MVDEGLQPEVFGRNPGTLLAENIFNNLGILEVVTSGGDFRDVTLLQIASDVTDLNPLGQTYFLRSLFQFMSGEKTVEFTDARVPALEILKGRAMETIIITNIDVVYDAYLDKLRLQDPRIEFSASLNTLLEAGKVIAPHLLIVDRDRRGQIVDTWEQIALQLPKSEEREQVRSKLGEIKQRMSTHWLLDAQVEELRNQGLNNSQIAVQLGQSIRRINKSVHRLLTAGRIDRLSKFGRTITEVARILDEHLANNPNEGVVLTEIARKLGITKTRVAQLYHEIAKTKKVPALKFRPDMTKSEALESEARQKRIKRQQLKSEVERLRNRGLGNKKISELTGIPIFRVHYILSQLIKQRKVRRLRRAWKTKEELKILDAKLIKLSSNPNLTLRKIAEMIEDDFYRVMNRRRKLIKAGKLKKRNS